MDRAAGFPIPSGVIANRRFDLQLRAHLAVETRLARRGKAGREPGQDGGRGLAEQIFRQARVPARLIVFRLELPAYARALVAAANLHCDDSRILDAAA